MSNRVDVVSVVIRTHNESRYLNELLGAISTQSLGSGYRVEVVVVDSGSTDNTIDIAKTHGAKITTIHKKDFTFGRSLNVGCKFSTGKYLVFISGHCIPADNSWLKCLIQPLINKECYYSYGRQVGRDTTKYSERQVFAKYFPTESAVPSVGFFCNNANAAILRTTWEEYLFDESLTGLEDMHLAKKIVNYGGFIGYSANAVVYHIHDESWQQVRHRYEREAIALQRIMPEVRISIINMVAFIVVGVWTDSIKALKSRIFFREIGDILKFRVMQFYGSYKGGHISKKMSQQAKMKYYYPEVRKNT